MVAQLLLRLRSLFRAKFIPNEVIDVKSLTSLQELDACLNESANHPVFIFKHSTTCPISAAAYRQVAQYVQDAGTADPEVSMVKVIEDRPVSNQIADQLALQHKSPQLMLVSDRAVVWSASHYGITTQAIRDAIASRVSGG